MLCNGQCINKRPQVSAVHFSLALRDSVEQRERAGNSSNRKVAAAVVPCSEHRGGGGGADTGVAVGELQVSHSSSMSMASREVPTRNLA